MAQVSLAFVCCRASSDASSNASAAERKSGTQENSVAIGMQGSERSVRWLYDHHFAAVVGDTVAFEAWPPKFDDGWCLHEWYANPSHLFNPARMANHVQAARPVGNAYWRDVGPGKAQRDVQRTKPVHILPHERTSACQGRDRKPAWCYRYLLVKSVSEIASPLPGRVLTCSGVGLCALA